MSFFWFCSGQFDMCEAWCAREAWHQFYLNCGSHYMLFIHWLGPFKQNKLWRAVRIYALCVCGSHWNPIQGKGTALAVVWFRFCHAIFSRARVRQFMCVSAVCVCEKDIYSNLIKLLRKFCVICITYHTHAHTPLSLSLHLYPKYIYNSNSGKMCSTFHRIYDSVST